MAKFIKKDTEFESFLFDASRPKSEWPERCQSNVKSPTGYSYGTLEERTAPMGPGNIIIDGIAIPAQCRIVFDKNGIPYYESDEEFNKKFIPTKFLSPVEEARSEPMKAPEPLPAPDSEPLPTPSVSILPDESKTKKRRKK